MMKKRKLIAVCLAMACMLVCCGCKDKGGTILIGSSEAQEDFSREESAPVPETPPEPESAETFIRVYVCGAVANPGVVEIPQGSRVEDALAAAGGFGADAGREAVNLADWVSDGQKLYFPTEEEAQGTWQSETGAEGSSGLVNINTADIAALCTLSGIGESRAKDIVAYREANGDFASCEDIMNVPGIKTAVYEKICDMITVK